MNTKKALKIVITILIISFVLLGAVVALVNSGNPLIGAEVKEYTMQSGSGNDIGKYAVVQLTNKQFDKLTPEYYYEFAAETVDGSGYNYFTVASKDGRGAIWNGCNIEVLTVGTVDTDYTVTETQTVYTLKDGAYVEIKD